MKLTLENINELKSERGGFKTAVVNLLQSPDTHPGWIRRLIGREIPDSDYELAKTLKNAGGKQQRKVLPQMKRVWG